MKSDGCLVAREPGDYGGEGIRVGLEEDIIGDAPALPAHLKIFNHLVHCANQYVRALQDLVGVNCIQRLANSSAASRRWFVTTTRCTSASARACVAVSSYTSYEVHSVIRCRTTAANSDN
jgi:hypothetical protein